MKKVILVFGVVCTLFVFACSKPDTPSSVAKKFHEALEKNDTKMLGQYTTPEAVTLMAAFGKKVQGMMASYGKVTEVTEEIDGDNASVTIQFENGETSNLDMVKVDGKWKVSVDK
ncbi:MAG: DUF4878 domain-containing protein [Spirochaetaceae bacterium]|jgi:hypothetical protein|nr:DUF4878 domain-containing protein [Spirochaetaceae bacterium]